MARTCTNCGRQAIDDQSRFCNKCGAPFTEDQPQKTVFVRTVPRMATTPPPPPPQPVQPVPPVQQAPPAPEYHEPAAPVYRPVPEVPAPPRQKARAPQAKPAREPVARPPAPALKLLVAKRIRLFYWLGVIAIILVVFAGITTKTATTAGEAAASEDAAKAATDALAGIPLFWIGTFIFAVLLWRAVCEVCAVQAALCDAPPSATTSAGPAPDELYEDELPGTWDGGSGASVQCPRCGKVVAASELRTCDHCGVQGCSSCIRLMGLVRKKWTCKDCFEKK